MPSSPRESLVRWLFEVLLVPQGRQRPDLQFSGCILHHFDGIKFGFLWFIGFFWENLRINWLSFGIYWANLDDYYGIGNGPSTLCQGLQKTLSPKHGDGEDELGFEWWMVGPLRESFFRWFLLGFLVLLVPLRSDLGRSGWFSQFSEGNQLGSDWINGLRGQLFRISRYWLSSPEILRKSYCRSVGDLRVSCRSQCIKRHPEIEGLLVDSRLQKISLWVEAIMDSIWEIVAGSGDGCSCIFEDYTWQRDRCNPMAFLFQYQLRRLLLSVLIIRCDLISILKGSDFFCLGLIWQLCDYKENARVMSGSSFAHQLSVSFLSLCSSASLFGYCIKVFLGLIVGFSLVHMSQSLMLGKQAVEKSLSAVISKLRIKTEVRQGVAVGKAEDTEMKDSDQATALSEGNSGFLRLVLHYWIRFMMVKDWDLVNRALIGLLGLCYVTPRASLGLGRKIITFCILWHLLRHKWRNTYVHLSLPFSVYFNSSGIHDGSLGYCEERFLGCGLLACMNMVQSLLWDKEYVEKSLEIILSQKLVPLWVVSYLYFGHTCAAALNHLCCTSLQGQNYLISKSNLPYLRLEKAELSGEQPLLSKVFL